MWLAVWDATRDLLREYDTLGVGVRDPDLEVVRTALPVRVRDPDLEVVRTPALPLVVRVREADSKGDSLVLLVSVVTGGKGLPVGASSETLQVAVGLGAISTSKPK